MIQLNARLMGEYCVEIKRGDGTIETTGWFKNLILNQGLNRLGSTSNDVVIQYAQVGSGTATPLVTNTQLQTYVASSQSQSYANSVSNSGSPDYYGQLTYIFAFTQGAVVATIGEVGVGWANTPGNNLFSRALILDNSGDPTTISVTSIDQLTIYYRLRVYPPLGDTTGTINISGTNYNYTLRVNNVTAFNNSQYTFVNTPYFNTGYSGAAYEPGVTMSAITVNGLTGSQTPNAYTTSSTAGSYTTGNYYLDSTITWSINQGNGTGGLQGIVFGWGQAYVPYSFKMVFNNPIPKDNTKTFSITMRFSWARA
jgi:hypothetical protein